MPQSTPTEPPLPIEAHSQAVENLDKLYEFERQPVTADKLQPFRYFAALLAGEHVAGTEFVIGALFVTWGVKTYDILIGLILGNLLAVLTWTLICTPIAVRTRLTLYWYLRKIAGPGTIMIYNVLNSLLFALLAGFMITVSASAVRMVFGIPPQTKWYPESVGFVLLCLGIGSVVVTLAILGFKRLAQFAEVCVPWMFVMFICGAVATLPGLAAASGLGGIHSFGDFWRLADKEIWTGATSTGAPSLTFWQVAAFAWICNLAMHGGLSDMALFRYARGIHAGLASGVGMFFGHYVAWICAGVMGAAAAKAMHAALVGLDAGAVAFNALGVAGAICVVLAGWTTANPTLYRCGLALQAVTPNWPRWLVTLLIGVFTTVVACFPLVFSSLMDYVFIYGLLLMPVGAIVFTEHWFFPRLGLMRYWAHYRKVWASWPALATWGVAVGCSLALYLTQAMHKFFIFLPIWFLTMILYTALAALAGARARYPGPEAAEAAEQARVDAAAATATAAVKEAAAGKKAAEKSGNAWIFQMNGWIALATLIGCLGLAAWVFTQGGEGYAARMKFFRVAISWLSVIHLASATVWAYHKEIREEA